MKAIFNLLIVDEDSASFEVIKSLVEDSKYADSINIILFAGGRKAFSPSQLDYIDLLFINKSFYRKGLYDNLFMSSKFYGEGGKGYVISEYSSFFLVASVYQKLTLLKETSPSSMADIISGNVSLFRGIIERYYKLCCLEEQLENRNSFYSIVAKSEGMNRVFRRIRQVAKSDSQVLILGESGTGKELVAEAIHKSSLYSSGPFVAINCTAIPKELIESELFGHKKGSFTGAIRDKPGYFVEADKGTLFLDEIGDLSFDLQVKLLRVLETKEIRAVGSERVRKVDLRIISATHRNLKEYIDKGRFREDLYFRLSVFAIKIPPLRERKQDIPLLAEYFLDELNKKYRAGKYLSKDAVGELAAYSWRGNVRELKNVMERLFRYSEEELIAFVPEDMFQFKIASSSFEKDWSSFKDGKVVSLAEGEKNIIYRVLSNSSNITESAKLLGISRDTLYRKMKRYNISYIDGRQETNKA